MSRDLLLSVSPGEVWAALVVDEMLAGLRLWRGGALGQLGDVVLGRVVALRPALPAALVDIGLPRPAFLSAEDADPALGVTRLHEGQAIIVQVTKEARADKATNVSMRLRLDAARRQALDAAAKAATPPATLEAPASPVVRALGDAVASAADLERLVIDDTAAFAEARGWLKRHVPTLVERLVLHREAAPLFEAMGVAGAIAEALAPRVMLPEGGALVIDPAAAATLIDVDSGAAEGRGRDVAEGILATNLAAARVAARQIQLRNLAGPIVIDFITMRRKGDRERVRAELSAALAADADSDILGWTRLGHLELVRKRRHAPLADVLFERVPGGGLVNTPLTTALAALRALQRAAAPGPAANLVLRVHPAVAAALEHEARGARRTLETRLARPIEVRAEATRLRETFDIAFE